MDKEDVPSAETLSKWKYLEDVVRTLPGVKDIPMGLLIGSNCPKALEPMEVISSRGGGPYAKRTRLGWCVSAPVQDEAPEELRCSKIKVCETRVKDVSIDMALQEMWRKDFIEKESEKKALSREDRIFLEEMKKTIKFSNGHYVLPLPIRVEAVSYTHLTLPTKAKV